MQKGWITRLRLHRCWLAQLAAAVLVLPILLGLLPLPSASASDLLERDLAASLCASTGPASPGGEGQHHPNHPDCVLCAVCSSAAGPVLAAAESAFTSHSDFAAASPPPAVLAGPGPSLLLPGSPPRGPPSLLLI